MTWNEDLKQKIDQKKAAHKIYIQTKDINDHITYKQLRAEVRKLTRKIRREDYDAFVKKLERDITGVQRIGFKVLKKLQQEERHRLNINNITNKKWKHHYAKVWNS
jgi:hypothetical protein